MRTMAVVVESARRNGRWRVFADGIQRLGAIMNNPWLQTAFSRSKELPTGRCINNCFSSSTIMLESFVDKNKLRHNNKKAD